MGMDWRSRTDGIAVRRQIQHMIKYRYVPFTVGKKRFSSAK